MGKKSPLSDRAIRSMAWLLVAMVVVQFYTAGLGMFGGASFSGHRVIGSASALVALLLLVVVLVTRRGREISLYALGCTILTVLQPVLIFVVRPRSPELAAIHPVVGLLIGVLAWLVATRGSSLHVAGIGQPLRDQS